jgi:hypothetical protein
LKKLREIPLLQTISAQQQQLLFLAWHECMRSQSKLTKETDNQVLSIGCMNTSFSHAKSATTKQKYWKFMGSLLMMMIIIIMNEWMNEWMTGISRRRTRKRKEASLQGSSWFWAFQKHPSYHHFGPVLIPLLPTKRVISSGPVYRFQPRITILIWIDLLQNIPAGYDHSYLVGDLRW